MKRHLSTEQIKAEAKRLGFSACGLAPAEAVDENTASAFRKWIAEGHHAEMNYMKNYEEKRLDPRLLVEGARTIISVALNYYPPTKLREDEYQIAWYAYGKDYHDVIKKKLNSLLDFIQRETVDNENHIQASSILVEGRVFCDTAPILERYWAWRCGLGWIGKNTQLIIPHAGSCFFLGEIIINREADQYDSPMQSRCGSCSRCIEACPTSSFEAPFRLNAERCLSYLTIEHHGELNPEIMKKAGNKIYGCDECLKACPWNRFATPTETDEFHLSTAILQMQKRDWQQLTNEQFRDLFKNSAAKRTKYSGLTRNIKAIKDNQ